MWTGGRRQRGQRAKPPVPPRRAKTVERLEFTSSAGPIVFDARKGAFLPDCETLLVADLHFEKELSASHRRRAAPDL